MLTLGRLSVPLSTTQIVTTLSLSEMLNILLLFLKSQMNVARLSTYVGLFTILVKSEKETEKIVKCLG